MLDVTTYNRVLVADTSSDCYVNLNRVLGLLTHCLSAQELEQPGHIHVSCLLTVRDVVLIGFNIWKGVLRWKLSHNGTHVALWTCP